MKTIKYLLLAVLGCMAAVNLSSCIDDNDDNGSTYEPMNQEQVAAYMSKIVGAHQGKMKVYFRKTGQENQDSAMVETSLTVNNDYTISHHDFPVSLLSHFIIEDQDLCDALEAQEDVHLTSNIIGFWNLKNNQTGVTSSFFYMLPKEGKLEFTLNYGGADHKVVVNFIETLYNFYSQGYLAGNKLRMQYIIQNVIVDNWAKVDYAGIYFQED